MDKLKILFYVEVEATEAIKFNREMTFGEFLEDLHEGRFEAKNGHEKFSETLGEMCKSDCIVVYDMTVYKLILENGQAVTIQKGLTNSLLIEPPISGWVETLKKHVK